MKFVIRTIECLVFICAVLLFSEDAMAFENKDMVHPNAQVIRSTSGGHDFIWKISCARSECLIGQFLGGDYWVAPKIAGDKVSLINISDSGDDGGLEINPVSSSRQGFLACHQKSYDSNLNYMSKLPFAVHSNSSLVKSHKKVGNCRTKSSGGCCVDAYNILTVLSSAPKDAGVNAFRPGFAGEKKVIFYLDQFSLNLLPKIADLYPAVKGANFEEIGHRWHSPFIDHYMNKLGDLGRSFAPVSVISDYGAEINSTYLNDLLLVMGEGYTPRTKYAVTGLIQRGVDLYASWKSGIVWPPGAGQQMGRKPPIALFGALVNDSAIKSDIMSMPLDFEMDTQEDGQIRKVDKPQGGGIPVWGDVGGKCSEDYYWTQLFASGKYDGSPYTPTKNQDNKKTCGDPYGWIDGPAGEPGTFYMACCSTGGFISYVLAQSLMPELCSVANDPQINTYVNRILDEGIHTTPDPCAPPDSRESSECLPFKQGAPECLFYKKTWGPDPLNPGYCIKNGTNGNAQSGRFSRMHGKKINKINNESPLSFYLRSKVGNSILNRCHNQLITKHEQYRRR